MSLKSYDLLTACALKRYAKDHVGYAELGHKLNISPSTVHSSVKRLEASGLAYDGKLNYHQFTEALPELLRIAGRQALKEPHDYLLAECLSRLRAATCLLPEKLRYYALGDLEALISERGDTMRWWAWASMLLPLPTCERVRAARRGNLGIALRIEERDKGGIRFIEQIISHVDLDFSKVNVAILTLEKMQKELWKP